MLAAISEAGWVSWFVVAAMAVGSILVVSVGRRTGRVGSVASRWSAVVVAIALQNASVGQHKVDAKLQLESDPARQVVMLSVGTREASSNLFVGGACTLVLISLAGLTTLPGSLARSRRSR